MQIYIATSHNPFYNLAVENWLFHHKLDNQPILYLWQNDPCVVIGRAQNPWRETHLEALNHDHITVVRRQSGGGTVFHDLGNLNYTILSPNHCYDKIANLEWICTVLKSLNLEPYRSPRNDILINGNDQQAYKISGSAFRETKDKSFHHGTLLVNCDTSRLYHYLHQPLDPHLAAKGVSSHRSKVINLNHINPEVNLDNILNAFINHSAYQPIYLSDNLNHPEIITEIDKLKSWDWRFGKTLPFNKITTYQGKQIILVVEKGCLVEVKGINLSDTIFRWLETKPRYCRHSIENMMNNIISKDDLGLLKHLHSFITYT